MIARRIIYFGQPAVIVCDARCDKAWGINNRPQVQFGHDPDDTALLADGELGEAPVDPGTYEGGHAKPTEPSERLNKWCVRECERSTTSRSGQSDEVVEVPDLSRRLYNQPWKHVAAQRTEAEGRNTESGSVHEGLFGKADAPIPASLPPARDTGAGTGASDESNSSPVTDQVFQAHKLLASLGKGRAPIDHAHRLRIASMRMTLPANADKLLAQADAIEAALATLSQQDQDGEVI